MVRALKWPRPGVGGRHTRTAGRPDATGFRSTAAGSIRRCPDGWLPRGRQDFMLEVLPPCYERRRIFRGSAAVKTQRPIISDDEHVVLKFRPRTSAHPPGGAEESDPAKTFSNKTFNDKTPN